MNITFTYYKYAMSFIIFILLSFSLKAHSQQAYSQQMNSGCLNLMPCPQKLNLAKGFVQLNKTPKIFIQGMSKARQKNVLTQVNLQLSRGEKTNFTGLLLVNDSAEADIEIIITTPTDKAENYYLPQLGDDESYQLTISGKSTFHKTKDKAGAKELKKQAHISIQANSDFGALHGLTTLVQVITTKNTESKWLLPKLTIDDKPRFKWRGLMLDSVRHFITLNTIKRQIDGMAAAKLNVFHWHLTDDQGWRFESKRYPKLHQLASDNLFYSQNEIKELVHYASLRGIRVVPEFDVPGHASAIAVAYPELMAEQKTYAMERHWGVFEPLLDVSNPKVYQFVDEIVEELTELFPDAYLHIGGDEVHPKQWENNADIKALMAKQALKNSDDVHSFFNIKLQKILAKHQRQMMGWDEIHHPDLPNNIMVQSWRGLDSLNLIAASGYQGLLSTGYYIDQPQYSSFHYLNDPQGISAVNQAQVQANHHITADDNEWWQTWSLTIPRLKGSAVKGSLTLIHNKSKDKQSPDNKILSGYLKLNDNHHKKINIHSPLTFDINHLEKQTLVFSMDSWMGPLRFELTLNKNQEAKVERRTDKVLIGNSYYPLTSELLTEQSKVIELLPALSSQQANNILGGEATLWTEMVDNKNIDLRTWPRLFAIAERFWSAKELTDVDSMYQRLMVIDDYAATTIGLHHQQQQYDGLVALFSPMIKQSTEMESALSALFIITQAFEPAHYYTRHHLKYQQHNYHQQAALDNFVDYLAVESFSVIGIKKQLKAFIAGDISALSPVTLSSINNLLTIWQENAQELSRFLQEQLKLQGKNQTNNADVMKLMPLLEELSAFTQTALDITQYCAEAKSLSEKQYYLVEQQLSLIEGQPREQVIAALPLFKQLLKHCHSLN